MFKVFDNDTRVNKKLAVKSSATNGIMVAGVFLGFEYSQNWLTKVWLRCGNLLVKQMEATLISCTGPGFDCRQLK